MNLMDWLESVGRPLSVGSVIGCILAGAIMSLIYWRKVQVSVYNALVYNLGFFVVMYVVRRLVDGIGTSAAYIGLYILYTIFMVSGFVTKRIWERFRSPYKQSA